MKTVLLVRHADIDLPPVSPSDAVIPLNAAGKVRAAVLARVVGGTGVKAIFTTAADRTRQTAAPLAAALGLTPAVMPGTLPAFAAVVNSAADGSVFLVVGHSPTLKDLIAALGAAFPGPPVGNDFDNLFVVTVAAPGQASAIRFKYGAGPAGVSFTDHAGATLRGTAVDVSGTVFGGKEKFLTAISGGDAVGECLVLLSDEVKDPTVVQVLKRSGTGYAAANTIPLPAGPKEVDLEGVAIDRATSTVYVTGSHCAARKIDGGVIEEVDDKKSRQQFFRFHLNPDGTAGAVDGPKSLMPAINANAVLQPFTLGASKENGVDIEGLAFKDGRLHFGFRGPVLRYGFVPVLSCAWADPEHSAAVRYVKLDGRGMRDLVAVADGFLVLAGPVGDGDGTYRVYFWDGADQLAAGDAGPGAQQVGEFAGLGDGKPEGVVLLKEEGRAFEILLLCDGLRNGGPTRWTITRP